jgi:hypothetical protein
LTAPAGTESGEGGRTSLRSPDSSAAAIFALRRISAECRAEGGGGVKQRRHEMKALSVVVARRLQAIVNSNAVSNVYVSERATEVCASEYGHWCYSRYSWIPAGSTGEVSGEHTQACWLTSKCCLHQCERGQSRHGLISDDQTAQCGSAASQGSVGTGACLTQCWVAQAGM